MPHRTLQRLSREPNVLVSIAIFVVAVVAMAYFRLHTFDQQVIALSYGLPLLICLFYRDKRLLWWMTASFLVLSAYKAFVLLPLGEDMIGPRSLQWGMQIGNMLIIAGAVHIIINLIEDLRSYNVRLEQSNQELIAREEEISRQNEELSAQTEELSQQNEEIQQQAEETQQQTEELQGAKNELEKREAILEMLVRSLDVDHSDGEVPPEIGEALLGLFSQSAVMALVWEQEGSELNLIASAGAPLPLHSRYDAGGLLAGTVMAGNGTAFIQDLLQRPDLLVPELGAAGARSVLAAPLRRQAGAFGAIEIYAARACAWTKEQFKLLEWAGAQCAVILEVRRLHRQLLRSNANLDALVRNRTAELQDMVNELEHFSYSITHDLRAPLRAMQGFAEMLGEECAGHLTDQSREYLRRLTTAGSRMDRLITDALVYSKTVREELALGAVDAGSLLRGMIESYPDFQLPSAEIVVAEDLPVVAANEAALTQCFSNLLGNAVKFVPKGTTPRVRVRGEQRDGLVRLWFEDNGIGISSDMQSRVFQMFQRASKEFEGTGIGLALVRKVTERMGGRVGVLSEPGKGSRFWVDLKTPARSTG